MAKLFKQIPSKPNSTLISSIVKSNSVVLGLFLATVDNAFIFLFFLPPRKVSLKIVISATHVVVSLTT